MTYQLVQINAADIIVFIPIGSPPQCMIREEDPEESLFFDTSFGAVSHPGH